MQGGAGCSWRMRVAAVVSCATSTAPAASVRRRAVAGCISAPVNHTRSRVALAKEGLCVLRRTKAS